MTMTDPITLANDVERMSDRLDTLEAEGRAEEPAYEDLWQARDEAIQAIADRHAPEAARRVLRRMGAHLGPAELGQFYPVVFKQALGA